MDVPLRDRENRKKARPWLESNPRPRSLGCDINACPAALSILLKASRSQLTIICFSPRRHLSAKIFGAIKSEPLF